MIIHKWSSYFLKNEETINFLETLFFTYLRIQNIIFCFNIVFLLIFFYGNSRTPNIINPLSVSITTHTPSFEVLQQAVQLKNTKHWPSRQTLP